MSTFLSIYINWVSSHPLCHHSLIRVSPNPLYTHVLSSCATVKWQWVLSKLHVAYQPILDGRGRSRCRNFNLWRCNHTQIQNFPTPQFPILIPNHQQNIRLHKSNRFWPVITFVNKSTKLFSTSSFPIRGISAATASRTKL